MGGVSVTQAAAQADRGWGSPLGSFMLGVLVAAPLIVLAVGAWGAAGFWLNRSESTMTSFGAAMDQVRGVSLRVQSRGRTIRLDCRGACDDLRLQQTVAVRRVAVVSSEGRCVACIDRRLPAMGVRQNWTWVGGELTLLPRGK